MNLHADKRRRMKFKYKTKNVNKKKRGYRLTLKRSTCWVLPHSSSSSSASTFNIHFMPTTIMILAPKYTFRIRYNVAKVKFQWRKNKNTFIRTIHTTKIHFIPIIFIILSFSYLAECRRYGAIACYCWRAELYFNWIEIRKPKDTNESYIVHLVHLDGMRS